MFNFSHIIEMLLELAVILPLLLVSIIAHEYAHGWAAHRLGDDTAKMMGRLSLNPLRHMDPIGTLMLVITPLLFGFIFGWAKPVPVNFFALRHYPVSMAVVALAGPATNLVFLLFGLILLKFGIMAHTPDFILSGIDWFVFLNLIIMLVNLFPIPPLDGSKVVYSFLSRRNAYMMMRYEIYGLVFLLILMVLAGNYIFNIIESIHRWLLTFVI